MKQPKTHNLRSYNIQVFYLHIPTTSMRPVFFIYALSCLLSGTFSAPSILAFNTDIPAVDRRHTQTFKNTCKRWELQQDGGNAWLMAYCADGSGGTWHSVLNLNHCIGNDAGKMVARSQGNFANTCHDLHLAVDTSMSATCAPTGLRSSIMLNDFVHNDQGKLSCFGFVGCARDSIGCSDKPSG
ncbi:Cyanovirin-N [Hypoxylon sp. FL0890]|nr:Cyanovirin-N [Hypoxylon sp. FL0890]